MMTGQTCFALTALLAGLVFSPLLSGVIFRVKARVAGRKGRPCLQLYYDLAKLMRKGLVLSDTATWFFPVGSAMVLASTLAALLLIPTGGVPAVFRFEGDFFFVAGLFALGRFGMIVAALDTGSPFEGMGSAREALFSAMAEPIFLLCMAVLAFQLQTFTLSGIARNIEFIIWAANWPFFLLMSIAMFLLTLTENARIPVDDPTTHLELTMIHEAMILDHSGPELAFMEYAASLKLWAFGLLVSALALPFGGNGVFSPEGAVEDLSGAFLAFGGTLAGVFGMALLIGLIESILARLRLERIPLILSLATAFTALAGLTAWR